MPISETTNTSKIIRVVKETAEEKEKALVNKILMRERAKLEAKKILAEETKKQKEEAELERILASKRIAAVAKEVFKQEEIDKEFLTKKDEIIWKEQVKEKLENRKKETEGERKERETKEEEELRKAEAEIFAEFGNE